MKALRVLLLVGAVLGIASFDTAGAKDEYQVQVPGGGFGRGGLLSSDALTKLNLTAEQKEKYEKISAEYGVKAKENSAKMRDLFKDKDKLKENLEAMRTESQKLRTDYLAKVEGLLTSEQKKTFDEVKNQQPQRGGFGQGGGGFGGFGGPRVGGDFLPQGAQEKLGLSEEQRKKVSELQKEMESKVLGVLTEEQKKQYEEMKKAAPGQRPGGEKGRAPAKKDV